MTRVWLTRRDLFVHPTQSLKRRAGTSRIFVFMTNSHNSRKPGRPFVCITSRSCLRRNHCSHPISGVIDVVYNPIARTKQPSEGDVVDLHIYPLWCVPFHTSHQHRPLWSDSVWNGVSVGKNVHDSPLQPPEPVVNRPFVEENDTRKVGKI